MAIFVVMEPPGAVRDNREADAVLVRDGFHFVAFLVPFLWLLYHRCWIEAALAGALSLGLGSAGAYFGFAGAPALSLLVSIYVGLEGAVLRVVALQRRGWREWGVIEAANRSEAEMRYLTETFDNAVNIEATPVGMAAALPWTPASSATGPALGLFSYPGRV